MHFLEDLDLGSRFFAIIDADEERKAVLEDNNARFLCSRNSNLRARSTQISSSLAQLRLSRSIKDLQRSLTEDLLTLFVHSINNFDIPSGIIIPCTRAHVFRVLIAHFPSR